MKLNNEIAKKIGIEYAFISDGTFNTFIEINEINNSLWKVCLQQDNQNLKNVNLTLRYNGTNYECHANLQKNKKNWSMKIESGNLDEVYSKIKKIEKKVADWSKRKEDRYEIGFENYSDFGFQSKQQKLIDASGKSNDCAVKDVSYHGMKIVAVDNEELQHGNYVIVMMKMNDSTCLVVKCEIKNKTLQKSKNGVIFSILSLKITEDSLEWMETIDRYRVNYIDSAPSVSA